MKYIRTKDGIFEITRQNNSCVMVKGKYLKEECKLKRKEDKQADTIEELCDYVVSMNELCDVPIVEELPHEMGNDKHFISNVKFQTLQGQHGKWWVKLAIATDKGLIYVAKINGKGELELL